MMKNKTFNVLYLFCGIGGGALGFHKANREYKGLIGRFNTLAGIDCDPEICEDFKNITGAPAAQLDLFSMEDYIAFHGQEPPKGWKEVTPDDIRNVCGGIAPDVIFTSPPCKGFSGLLPEKSAQTEKYQALNRLTVRGIFLTLEAFRDELPAMYLFENVPRITTRGKNLLHTIKGTLQSYGYLFNEATHDCGVIGGLAQHRRRYLLIARNPQKVSSFVYQPPEKKVKSIGEVIGPLPLPDDPKGGPMHKMQRLQWKTWVRLALIPAGGDWRDLENINPSQYKLEYAPRGGGPYGVMDWDKPSCTVIGNAGIKGSNAAAIADPRLKPRESRHASVYKVIKYNEPANTITGTRFGSGALAISDPRTGFKDSTHHTIYKVTKWDESAKTITGANRPNNGAITITDPRTSGGYQNKYQLLKWEGTASTVTGTSDIQSGAQSIADPRLSCKPRSGTMGVQSWDNPGKTIIGAGDIHAGSTAVADPRIPNDNDRPDPPPIIIALDGTWHRPLTTLELAILQSFPMFMADGSPLILSGKSDARWRERIGNAVPPDAAEEMAKVILKALLVSEFGEWELGSTEIWVSPNMDEQSNKEVIA